MGCCTVRGSHLQGSRGRVVRSCTCSIHKTVHVSVSLIVRVTQKDNPMAGRISITPFVLVVWNEDFCPYGHMRPLEWGVITSVCYDGVILPITRNNLVRVIRIRMSTARNRGVVGLHQTLIPLADSRVVSFPLAIISCAARERLR